MTTPKYNILVVEDNSLHIESARVLLADHNLTIASDFVTAVDSLAGQNVVLTDLMFPYGRREGLPGVLTALSSRYHTPDPLPMGFPFMLYAAQCKPYVAVVTDLDHHQGGLAASFGLFKTERKPDELRISGCRVKLFDIRDLPTVYKLSNGKLTQDEKEAGADFGTHGSENFPVPVKNWSAALHELVQK